MPSTVKAQPPGRARVQETKIQYREQKQEEEEEQEEETEGLKRDLIYDGKERRGYKVETALQYAF